LPIYDQRIQDRPAIFDDDVANDLDLARLDVDVDLDRVGRIGVRERRRFVSHGNLEPGIVRGREWRSSEPDRAGDVGDRNDRRAVGETADGAVPEIEVGHRDLRDARGGEQQLGTNALRRSQHGAAGYDGALRPPG